ncbi:hypothetical protein AAFF_G00096950 [Aldrovandia affinis]|uniref:Uncharacterized protein n=1 Tax=Aldrovandia affinis TaxID=143900 RepID=A0AAD7RVG6_9TELE|nr:hypothetical protein AAFF_G00096950 [Aldrovandia affinis]
MKFHLSEEAFPIEPENSAPAAYVALAQRRRSDFSRTSESKWLAEGRGGEETGTSWSLREGRGSGMCFTPVKSHSLQPPDTLKRAHRGTHTFPHCLSTSTQPPYHPRSPPTPPSTYRPDGALRLGVVTERLEVPSNERTEPSETPGRAGELRRCGGNLAAAPGPDD